MRLITAAPVVKHAGLALALAALAAPGALAQTPDSVDNNRAARERQARQLQSPDARDANRQAAAVPVRSSSPISPAREPSGAKGLDWGDAAIGAGGALGVVLLAGGGAMTAARRRGHAHAA